MRNPWVIDLPTAVALVPPDREGPWKQGGFQQKVEPQLWKALDADYDASPPHWFVSRLAQELAYAPAGYVVTDELLRLGQQNLSPAAGSHRSRSTSSSMSGRPRPRNFPPANLPMEPSLPTAERPKSGGRGAAARLRAQASARHGGRQDWYRGELAASEGAESNLLDQVGRLLPSPRYIPSTPEFDPQIPGIDNFMVGSERRRSVRAALQPVVDTDSAEADGGELDQIVPLGSPQRSVSRRVSMATSPDASSMHFKRKGKIAKDSNDSMGASLLREIKAAPLLRQLNKSLPAGARICILGAKVIDAGQETVITSVARSLSKLDSHFCILTTGGVGAQRCFAEAFVDPTRVFNLLVRKPSSGYDQGVDIHLGDDMYIFRKLLKKSANIYLLFGGGSGVEREVVAAQKTGALVLPFPQMGGAAASKAIKRPQHIEDDQWDCVCESTNPEEVSEVVAAVVEVFVSKVTQSLQPYELELDDMEQEKAARLRELDMAVDPQAWMASRLSPAGPLVLVEDLEHNIAMGSIQSLKEAMEKVEVQGQQFVDSLGIYAGQDGLNVLARAKARLQELLGTEAKLQTAIQDSKAIIDTSAAVGTSGAFGATSNSKKDKERRKTEARRGTLNKEERQEGEPEKTNPPAAASEAGRQRFRRTVLQLRDVAASVSGQDMMVKQRSVHMNELAGRATFAHAQDQLEQAERDLRRKLHEARDGQGLRGPVCDEASAMLHSSFKAAKVSLFERYVRSVAGVFESLKEAVRLDSKLQLEVALARCRLEVGAHSLIGDEALQMAEAAGFDTGLPDSADPWKSLNISSYPWEAVFKAAVKRWVQLRELERLTWEPLSPTSPRGVSGDFLHNLASPLLVSLHEVPDME